MKDFLSDFTSQSASKLNNYCSRNTGENNGEYSNPMEGLLSLISISETGSCLLHINLMKSLLNFASTSDPGCGIAGLQLYVPA